MKSKKFIAEQFGKCLDNDDFENAKVLLDPKCKYRIGDKIISGQDAICNSYEQNMIEGRKKLDSLIWGDSRVEKVNDSDFFIHYTDYLMHKGVEHTFKCKQLVSVNDDYTIFKIEHFEDESERDKLNKFYQKVGLK